jgi:hypothetical protein
MKFIKRYLSIMREKNTRALILLVIVVFNLLLWFGSSLLAYALSPNHYGDILSSLWQSGITWMLEPGFYDPTVDYAIRILSIVVILTSMITFSGGIIGYVASLFSSIIDRAETGQSPLYIYDHILILNWNPKALELIVDYCFDEKTTHVVVLSSHDKKEIEEEISKKLYDLKGQKHKKIQVIVRQGDVLSKKDLLENHIESSKTIIILDDEHTEITNQNHQDIFAIKTLMLLNQFDIKPNQTIIAEVKSLASKHMIDTYISKNMKLSNQLVTILPDELMGRLIAQTILMPPLNEVYAELFSFKGAEFYSIPKMDPLVFMQTHKKAIPIYTLNDKLFVLAESLEAISEQRSVPLNTYNPIQFKHQNRYHDRHLVIIGNNNKLEFIIDSIHRFEKENNTQVHITMIDQVDANSIFQSLEKIEKIDTVLILSDDLLEPKDYDSDVLITLLLTQDIVKKHNADVVIELLNPKHYEIAKCYNVTNTIISNEYISRIITQLSKNRSLYPLYMDLLTYDADDAEEETYEVYAYKASDIFEGSYPKHFSSAAELIYACYQSSNQEFVVIGLYQNTMKTIFKGDLDLKQTIVIEPNDTIIVICK